MEENGHKLSTEHRLTSLSKDVEYLQTDMNFVKSQVSNHIPTTLRGLEDKIESFINANRRQMIAILIGLIMLLVGVVVDLAIRL